MEKINMVLFRCIENFLIETIELPFHEYRGKKLTF